MTFPNQLVEDQIPVFDEPQDECEHLSPLVRARTSVAQQALEENDRMGDHLAAFVFKFKGDVLLLLMPLSLHFPFQSNRFCLGSVYFLSPLM